MILKKKKWYDPIWSSVALVDHWSYVGAEWKIELENQKGHC